MCEHGTYSQITIERTLFVDACLADRVIELNKQGVYTTGCCCSHGKGQAAATILPSTAVRAQELGYEVHYNDGGDPWIAI